MACGHVRYSTTGSSVLANVQPFIVNFAGMTIALGHNGNLVNAAALKRQLEHQGSIFQSTMDSEVVMHLIARNIDKGFRAALVDAIKEVRGAYSFLMLTEDTLVAARDPQGFRPLCLGLLDDAYVVASETCALDLIGARYLRDVEPGEVIFIDHNGMESVKPFAEQRLAHCIFEFIYFARPDSNIYGQNVYTVRQRQGGPAGGRAPRDTGRFCDALPGQRQLRGPGLCQGQRPAL